MSYCKISVVYGTYITEELSTLTEVMYNQDDPRVDDNGELIGFETLYASGAEHTPGYCGVELCEFDEATSEAINLNSLKLQPTDEQKSKANEMYNALHYEIRNICPPLGIYLVFHSS